MSITIEYKGNFFYLTYCRSAVNFENLKDKVRIEGGVIQGK